ncbi:TIR domain-containing protein [Candidatus Wolfebacteria bacterium]|nr:TIR domain-containing protein [Candidatus Wolfebacteria bacterium]
MARKIFVSYKHEDTNVRPMPNGINGTARDYVDVLEDIFEGEEIYKGERADEDLSEFTESTIRSQLRDQIFDSTVTVVLVSREMVNQAVPERDQFIPWEIVYSLQRRSRGDRISDTNAVLVVVLPSSNGLYRYFIQEQTCNGCSTIMLMTDNTFKVISDNMFNSVEETESSCQHCGIVSHYGDHSYISYVKWDDFIENPDLFITEAQRRKDNLSKFKLKKALDD